VGTAAHAHPASQHPAALAETTASVQLPASLAAAAKAKRSAPMRIYRIFAKTSFFLQQLL